MTQEALKQMNLALETMEAAGKRIDELKAENKALKEALAQPERDYERGFIDGMQKQMQSSVDKAVNRMAQTQERPVDCERCNRLEEQAYDLVGKLRVANIKLSMQPQRTWVGLTDEEVEGYWDWEDFQCGAGRSTILEMVRDIEAKLKELNT